MKHILRLIIIIGTMQIIVYCTNTKEVEYDAEDFQLTYVMSGLGSNLGQMMPKLVVKGNEFVLTSEQNSSLGGRTKEPILEQKGRISTASINEILSITNSLNKYEIKTHSSSMSGSIIYLKIKNNNQEWNFQLMNEPDKTASQIIDILNEHLDDIELFDQDYSKLESITVDLDSLLDTEH